MTGLATRGTTNRNARGSSYDRLRRREWLVATFRADVDAQVVQPWPDPPKRLPACRCYRCGVLLTVDTVTVDRIIPGTKGGTYRRNNIRPSCATCNSSTGGALSGTGAGR